MSEELTQVNVGGTSIGLLGLRGVFAEVQQPGLDDETRCREEILRRVKKQNYIPSSADQKYSQALWREYRRRRGETIAEEASAGLVIKILGPGCYACDKLREDVVEVLAEMGLAADVEHVRDTKRIGQYGMVGIPALVINNKVKLSGRVLPKRRLKEMIAAEVKAKTRK